VQVYDLLQEHQEGGKDPVHVRIRPNGQPEVGEVLPRPVYTVGDVKVC